MVKKLYNKGFKKSSVGEICKFSLFNEKRERELLNERFLTKKRFT